MSIEQETQSAMADEDPPTVADDRSAADLDDTRDREELRRRYYGLLQELRVLLPGTQVLVAFLLTVPFDSRFLDLDDLSKRLYAGALGAGVLAIVALIAPTAFHRFGPRRSRSGRLRWSIQLVRVGLFLLAVSLVLSLVVVTRLVFGPPAGAAVAACGTVVLLAVWVVLPRYAIPSGPEHGDTAG